MSDSPSTVAVADLPASDRVSGARPAIAELPVTIISPHQGWFDWRLRQLWRYRDLISLFVWRDFVAVYKQTVLGPTWHVIRPLLTTLIFTVVFGRMAGLSTDGAPPFLFYLTGSVAWAYFATSIDNISKTLVANASLLGKVYFHRLTIPVSLVISNLIAFGIQLALVLVAVAAYAIAGRPVHLTPWIAAVPIVVALLAGYALGGGIIVCALTTRYRDLTYVVSLGVQLLMYVTPVIFPASSVPPAYKWVIYINPLAPLIEGFRYGLLGVGSVTVEQIVISGLGMVAMLIGGLMLFTRVERTFMDTV